MQAITSAGIVYSIARACSREEIRQCSCDNTDRTPPEDGEFQWGGCGDNLEHGYNYARRFAGYAISGDASSLLNDHNSEAGRLVSKLFKFLIIRAACTFSPYHLDYVHHTVNQYGYSFRDEGIHIIVYVLLL